MTITYAVAGKTGFQSITLAGWDAPYMHNALTCLIARREGVASFDVTIVL